MVSSIDALKTCIPRPPFHQEETDEYDFIMVVTETIDGNVVIAGKITGGSLLDTTDDSFDVVATKVSVENRGVIWTYQVRK